MNVRPRPATRPASPAPTGGRQGASRERARLAVSLLALAVCLAGPASAQVLRGNNDVTDAEDAARRAALAKPKPGAAMANPDPLGLDASGVPRPTAGDPVTTAADQDAAAAATAAAAARTAAIPRKPKPVATRGPVAPVAPMTATVVPRPVTPRPAIQPDPRDLRAAEREEAEKEDDGYTQLGLRSGGMLWLPAVEASVGRKTNVDSTAGGRASWLWMLEPELIARSDWSRHALAMRLRGGWTGYSGASDLSQGRFESELRGRVDIGEATRADIVGGWSRQRETASANEASTGGAGTDRSTLTASLGVTHEVGRIGVTLRGDVERNDYVANGTLAAGVVDPSMRDNTLFVGALRATVGPRQAIAPFVEVQTRVRRYDEPIVYSHRRDTEGGAVKVGIAADAGPMLRGEFAVGWGTEKPRDAALSTISDWLVDAKLTWSPTRLTTVKVKATTTVEPTTNVGSPGAVARAAEVALDWSLRRDLTATVGSAVDTRHYVGLDIDERTVGAFGGLTYKFDRNFQTFVRLRWDHVTASNAAAYDVGTVTTGVRIQR